MRRILFTLLLLIPFITGCVESVSESKTIAGKVQVYENNHTTYYAVADDQTYTEVSMSEYAVIKAGDEVSGYWQEDY